MLGGLNCLRYLLKYDEGKRKPAVRAQDVHDILVPLFRGRTDAAKDEACKALRLLISDVSWTEAAAPVFEKLGVGSGKLYSLVNEMNAFENMKQQRTLGKSVDQYRPGGRPFTTKLDRRERVDALSPATLAAYFGRTLPPSSTIVDVGAGTGIFSLAFAAELPDCQVFSLEVRSDAIRTIRGKARRAGVEDRVTPMRMPPSVAPELPGGRRAALVFMCDVLHLVGEGEREGLACSLRALLADGGRLVAVEQREVADNLLIDIQDAGFIQCRCPQLVADRRVMCFDVDPTAPPSPPLQQPPSPLDTDEGEEEEEHAEEGGEEARQAAPTGASVPPLVMRAETVQVPSQDVDVNGGGGGGGSACVLEDNPGGPIATDDDDDDDDHDLMLEDNFPIRGAS